MQSVKTDEDAPAADTPGRMQTLWWVLSRLALAWGLLFVIGIAMGPIATVIGPYVWAVLFALLLLSK